MQIIKKIVFSMLVLSSSYSYSEPITVGILIAASIGALAQSYFVGKDIYKECNPDAQQQTKDIEAEEYREYVEAKMNFKKCLQARKGKLEMDKYNYPVGCEDLARALIECGGKQDMIVMMNNINEVRNK